MRAFLILAATVVLLLPCFWQPLIQAGDFSSHVYNAWLVEQIEAGRVQGLWVASQQTNVLFDLLLTFLLRTIDMGMAQRIAAGILVMIFAWGAMALASAEARRAVWFLFPAVAILAYGWVFHVGFANFYLALGISLWALALVWNRWTIPRVAGALALLAIASTGHMLPVAWAGGAAVYGWISRRLDNRRRMLLGAAVLVCIFALRVFLMTRFETLWALSQAFGVTGADQAWVYGAKYFAISVLLMAVWTFLLQRRVDAEGGRSVLLGAPFQIFLITAALVVLIPTRVHLPGYEHALVYISHRMSLPAALMLCVSLASVRPSRWQAGGLLAAAVLFFSFLFADTHALNGLEREMERVVDRIPASQRVVSALCEPGSRVDPLGHMVDRVCVGRCFSYANYEPSTTQFRVRANPGNGAVTSSYGDSYALQAGAYRVRPTDLPLYEIYFCRENALELCVRPLKAGDMSGRTCRQVTPRLW